MLIVGVFKVVVCGVCWVIFKLVVEIVFVEVILDGVLCYLSFIGLCEDKVVKDVVVEIFVLFFDVVLRSSIKVSSCDCLIFDKLDVIKGDFVDYYVVVFGIMFLFVVNCLISLVCCL